MHELRACLDSLACQLAVRNGRTAKDTYFPISANRTVFEKDGHRKIRKLSDADKRAIEILKPYGGGNEMLLALHRADLLRKHQRLIMQGGYAGIEGRGEWVTELAMNPNITLTGRHPVARWRGRNNFQLNIHVALGFSEPDAIAGQPVTAAIQDFASLVHSIVRIFE